jgi:hypothetical protein
LSLELPITVATVRRRMAGHPGIKTETDEDEYNFEIDGATSRYTKSPNPKSSKDAKDMNRIDDTNIAIRTNLSYISSYF